jgi:thiol-disulfide isomerase/thioredoxin
VLFAFLAIGLSGTRVNAAPEVGDLAPEFLARTSEGDTVRLSDYRGRVVILDFWASWCPPCREELPFLLSLAAVHRTKALDLIAVNIDDRSENMDKFLSGVRTDAGTMVVDREKALPALYDIETMPTTVFIDREGRIRYWHNGFSASEEATYEQELRILLTEK